MQNLAFTGLVLDIIGVGILVKDELTTYAAIIKRKKSSPDYWWQVLPFIFAKKYGSKDPFNTEIIAGESFSKRFWGFFLILLGFLFQALAIAF